MILIDGDYPMAHNALKFDRNLTQELDLVRKEGIDNSDRDPLGYSIMCSLPEMRKAEIAASIVKIVSCIKKPDNDHGDVSTQIHAYASGKAQMAYYHMLQRLNEVKLLKNKNEFIWFVHPFSKSVFGF